MGKKYVYKVTYESSVGVVTSNDDEAINAVMDMVIGVEKIVKVELMEGDCNKLCNIIETRFGGLT